DPGRAPLLSPLELQLRLADRQARRRQLGARQATTGPRHRRSSGEGLRAERPLEHAAAGGRADVLTHEALEEIGVAMAVAPAHGLGEAEAALQDALLATDVEHE